ncbi:MAG: DEAD/DEAH box helicase [Polyangiaceae bacterium]|nr:DEAD/DEAH box helicase [Polyangiaceae bacterium]
MDTAFELLDARLAQTLRDKGFTSLTPVQQAVCAHGSAEVDFRISSQTGSGKTVAFAMVLAQTWERQMEVARPEFLGAVPRVAVIVPTRELATQVERELRWALSYLKAPVVSVTGGTSVSGDRRLLHKFRGILVGTPGRVCDHIRTKVLDLSALETLVLDEADQMLDLGFRDELDQIVESCPPTRRTHFVSATFRPEIKRLAERYQKKAVQLEGTPLGSANSDIQHIAHLIHPDDREGALINTLLASIGQKTLVFARTRQDVRDLSDFLNEQGFSAAPISGELEQRQRDRALAAFKSGHTSILVATDVAARGIHVEDIELVIHVDPPSDAELYVHRSGRTGRAGKKGRSILLVPARSRARAERLFAIAGVRARFLPAPDAAMISKNQLEGLKQQVADQLTRPIPSSLDYLTLAKELLTDQDPAELVARLLADTKLQGGPCEPRELRSVAAPTPMRKGPPAKAFAAQSGPVSGPRGAGPRTMPPDARPKERTSVEGFARFRVSMGNRHGATPQRILSMVCRRGGISGADVGAIRIEEAFTTLEVNRAVANMFAKKSGRPDERDPEVRISPAPSGPPAKAARGAFAPPGR